MNGAERGAKRVVTAALVKQLLHAVRGRNMTLLPYRTRCVRQGEIHELVTTDAAAVGPDGLVRDVGFVGFVEIVAGGVIEEGDEVWAGDRRLGTVLGFDGCHWPNHYNVVLGRPDGPATGGDFGLTVEAAVRFVPGALCDCSGTPSTTAAASERP